MKKSVNHLLCITLLILMSAGMFNCTEKFVPTTIVIDPNGSSTTSYPATTPNINPNTDPQNPNNGGSGSTSGGSTNTGGGATSNIPITGNNGGGTTGVSGGTGYPLPTPGANRYSDSPSMLYLDNGTLRIGLNTQLGGALTYISSSNGTGYYYNMVNNYDLGREIQQAFFSDPITSQAGPPNDKVVWNPNQAGDNFGNLPPPVIESRRSGNTIYVKARPMIWAMKNLPCECIMETWVELQNNVIKYKGRFTNDRGDKKFYNSQYQSIPAMFLNGAYERLVTYAGDKPFSGEPLTFSSLYPPSPQDKFIFGAENWAALVNKSDYGIGIWSDNLYQFVTGASSISWSDTRYEGDAHETHIQPVQLDHLDHNIVYEFQADLIVGKVSEIRQYVYKKDHPIKLPDYHFKKDRQHWSYVNDLKDVGWPIQNEELAINPLNKGGQMFGPHVLWNATNIPKIYLKMASKTKAKNARLFWRKFGDTQNFADNQCITFDVIPDGEYHTYVLDLSKISTWNGKIIQLLFAPFGYSDVNLTDEVRIKSISALPD